MIEAILFADSEYSTVKLKQFEKLQCLIPKTLPTPSCDKIVLPRKYKVSRHLRTKHKFCNLKYRKRNGQMASEWSVVIPVFSLAFCD